MKRAQAGKCDFHGGRHKWVDMTTKEQAALGQRAYTCAYCRKEAIE